MSKLKIVIVDYGVGNVLSLSRAISKCGEKSILTSNSKEIESATHVFLPGVGAFKTAIRLLEEKKILEVLKKLDFSKIKIMGICLGMQLLFESSEEQELTNGLGLIKGKIEKIVIKKEKKKNFKVPNIGWHNMNFKDQKNIFVNIKGGSFVYFVHSYRAVIKNEEDCLSSIDYGGVMIPAVINKNNIYGCQFHPEKSGEYGVNLIKSFLFS